ncbi:MAG: hypothetical protein ASARMPREDX12_002963 [Alectoria sarmentosa]|nr:MAG: hypothetical protein ASARMPREDX12_002963 [Alectoria sarmentosa]
MKVQVNVIVGLLLVHDKHTSDPSAHRAELQQIHRGHRSSSDGCIADWKTLAGFHTVSVDIAPRAQPGENDIPRSIQTRLGASSKKCDLMTSGISQKSSSLTWGVAGVPTAEHQEKEAMSTGWKGKISSADGEVSKEDAKVNPRLRNPTTTTANNNHRRTQQIPIMVLTTPPQRVPQAKQHQQERKRTLAGKGRIPAACNSDSKVQVCD